MLEPSYDIRCILTQSSDRVPSRNILSSLRGIIHMAVNTVTICFVGKNGIDTTGSKDSTAPVQKGTEIQGKLSFFLEYTYRTCHSGHRPDDQTLLHTILPAKYLYMSCGSLIHSSKNKRQKTYYRHYPANLRFTSFSSFPSVIRLFSKETAICVNTAA